MGEGTKVDQNNRRCVLRGSCHVNEHAPVRGKSELTQGNIIDTGDRRGSCVAVG